MALFQKSVVLLTPTLDKIGVRIYTLLQEQQKNVSCRLLEK